MSTRAALAARQQSSDTTIKQLQHSWSSNQASLRLQPKLAVGAVNDPLEHEADCVAEQVTRMPERDALVAPEPAQLNRKCVACEEEEEKLQKKPAEPQSAVSEAPAIVHEVLRSSGQPLDTATRAYFEPRFGHDFSQVRVHPDARAAESAREVHARAYTVGSNVVFAANEYAPTTYRGRELLAHELAHTIQQRNASAPPPSADSSGIFEASAYAAARSIANGEVVSRDLPACGIGLAPQVAPPSALSEQDLAEELKQATEDLKPGEQPGWWLNALRREAESRASLRARVERERTERIAAAKRAAAAERQRKERAAAVAEAEAGIARLEKQSKEGDKDDDIPAPRIPSRPTTLSLLPPDPRFKAQQQFAAEWIDRVEKQTDAELKRIDKQIQHDKDIANTSKEGSYQYRLRKVRSELRKLSPSWYSWDEAVSRMTGDEVWLWGVNNGLFIESEKRAVYEDQNSMQQLIREEQEEANRRRRAQFGSEWYQRWVDQGEQNRSPALIIQPFAFAALSPFAGAAYAGTQIGEMLGEAYNACAHGSTEECLSATAKAGIAIALERGTRGEPKPGVQKEPTIPPMPRHIDVTGGSEFPRPPEPVQIPVPSEVPEPTQTSPPPGFETSQYVETEVAIEPLPPGQTSPAQKQRPPGQTPPAQKQLMPGQPAPKQIPAFSHGTEDEIARLMDEHPGLSRVNAERALEGPVDENGRPIGAIPITSGKYTKPGTGDPPKMADIEFRKPSPHGSPLVLRREVKVSGAGRSGFNWAVTDAAAKLTREAETELQLRRGGGELLIQLPAGTTADAARSLVQRFKGSVVDKPGGVQKFGPYRSIRITIVDPSGTVLLDEPLEFPPSRIPPTGGPAPASSGAPPH